MSLLALLHKLATWGDQDRSELICIPRYFTNETVARGVPSTIKHGGGLMFFFLEMSIEQHFAGCRESSELLIQDIIVIYRAKLVLHTRSQSCGILPTL